MRSRKLFWRALFILPLMLLVAGCTGVNSAQTTDVSVAPDPIVLRDTSPGQLALFVALNMGSYDPATRDMTTIHIGIEAQNRPVQFVADEKMACQGTPLQRFIGAFDGSFPTAAIAGKPMLCAYTSGQTSATVTFTVPAAPAILLPEDNAQLPRSAHTLVQYRLTPGTLVGVVVLGTRDKAVPQPGTQSNSQAIFDTSTFSPGSGTISLTQDLSLPDLHQMGFKSLNSRGSAITMIEVIWI